MNKKEAKLIALRTATGMMYNGIDLQDDFDLQDVFKIQKEFEIIGEMLYRKAAKIGGDFNRYSGDSVEKSI
jgi:hypothetical protein